MLEFHYSIIMNKKKIPLSLNFGKIFLTVALLVIFTVGLLFAWWIVARADREARTELLQQAQLVMQAIDIDRIRALSGTEADLEKPEYRRITEQFKAACSIKKGWRWLYLAGRRSEGKVSLRSSSRRSSCRKKMSWIF